MPTPQATRAAAPDTLHELPHWAQQDTAPLRRDRAHAR